MDLLHQLNIQIGKAVCVPLFDAFNGYSTSIKEVNRYSKCLFFCLMFLMDVLL